MLLILLGKTCSDKTTIVNELKKRGFSSIVAYTTRPIRNGECQDTTYHFITEEEFLTKVQDGFFLEYKTYKTIDGTWCYGTAEDDLLNIKENTVVILTPDGYREYLNKYPGQVHKSVYLYANNSTIRKRLLDRGDKKEEAERRIRRDNKDFKGTAHLADKIIYNNDQTHLEDVVNKIIAYMEEQ